MLNLFTPAGDTDPVRGYHDGAILHILRHYSVDRVIVFLTREMEAKEDHLACYTRGIQAVRPQVSIEFIRSGITDPQNYEKLVQIQDVFETYYQQYPDNDWLLNISSGTPQIKTVMSFLALDYPRTKAVQVLSPERKSNRENHPCTTVDELVEMLEVNEDNEANAPNRCLEPPLFLLKRHSLNKQLISLIKAYEYPTALKLVMREKTLFPGVTEQLLQHACLRLDLQWKKANKIISSYKGKILEKQQDNFLEYFQLLELRQKKKQLADFIIKISPVLVEIGKKYVDTIPGFSLKRCGEQRRNVFWITRDALDKNYPELLKFIDYGKSFRDTRLYFWFLLTICQFYAGNELQKDERHRKVTFNFDQLRKIEESLRNGLAHEITNLTEEKILEITQSALGKPYQSEEILRLLQDTVQLVRGNRVPWTYDSLNQCIEDSLKERV